MKKVINTLLFLTMFLFSKTAFASFNDDLIRKVLDGDTCTSCRFFAKFYDFMSGSLFSFYTMLVPYLKVAIFLGISWWILNYTWTKLIKPNMGNWEGAAAISPSQYWKDFFKLLIRSSIVLTTILLVIPSNSSLLSNNHSSDEVVSPKEIFKYTLDPIVMLGTVSGRYLMTKYTDDFINNEQNPKIKAVAKAKLTQGNFCREQINKPSTFSKDGTFQDPNFSLNPNRQLMNDGLKMEFICLIDSYQKLVSSFQVYSIRLQDIELIKFFNMTGWGYFFTIFLLLIFICWIYYSIKNSGFLGLVGSLPIFISLFLVIGVIYSNVGFLLLALFYWGLSWYLQFLGGFLMIGDFIVISIVYMVLPILCTAWIFGMDSEFKSLSSVLKGFKDIAIGILFMSISYVFVMAMNESFLKVFYRGDDKILLDLNNKIINADLSGLVSANLVMVLFTNILLLYITCIFLNKTGAIASSFGGVALPEGAKLMNDVKSKISSAGKKLFGARKNKNVSKMINSFNNKKKDDNSENE